MTFTATDEQIVEAGKLAILASMPRGLGLIHYDPHLSKDDIELDVSGGLLDIDYYQGRMVKFLARRHGAGTWSVSDTLDDEYQSWATTYPSYAALLEAVVRGES